MFVIKLKAKLSRENLYNGPLALLSFFKVNYHSLYKSEGQNTTEVVVVDQGDERELKLAEQCFQMAYKQVGIVCPICAQEGKEICEHLTFIQ